MVCVIILVFLISPTKIQTISETAKFCVDFQQLKIQLQITEKTKKFWKLEKITVPLQKHNSHKDG